MESDLDIDEPQNEERPVIIRGYGKCPREYKSGEDFRSYITRFSLNCDLNQIPERQRGSLLFTLLDSASFESATNLQLPNLNDFDLIKELLTTKFDGPAGELDQPARSSFVHPNPAHERQPGSSFCGKNRS